MIGVMAGPCRLARLSVAAAYLLLGIARAAAGGGEYPLIGALSAEDLLYRQITADVATFHYAEANAAQGAVPPALLLFRFRPGPGDDISAVAARLNITQATLATLNRVSSPTAFRLLDEVLVANIPGIFVPDAPATDFERALASARPTRGAVASRVLLTRAGAPVGGRFIPGDDFSAAELVRFLRGFFRAPLESGRLSSRFGLRISPFDGTSGFHGGIDLVAPKGAPVMAAASGQVTEVGSSGQYGRYVILTHDASFQTLYAHLDTVAVGLRDRVVSGTIVGAVGNSGLTTGTHLHFEVRLDGRAVDPLHYLPSDWSRR
jgi:murein DD-endopeptidase MepM/ murein hydrolase activator NlpD